MQHWNSYWQQTKTLNSFAEGEQSQGYGGDIASFWQRVFTEQDHQATVLDLATGNGGLAVLALQQCVTFDVYAADLASIAPLQLFDQHDAVYPLLQKIHFYPNMAAEQLSFADQKFDLVVSQFGFEYASPEAALQQIYRVLKPAGQFVALVHHQQSFITQDCQAGLQALQYFMMSGGLLDNALDYAMLCQQLALQQPLTAEQQQVLKQHSSSLLARFQQQQQLLQGQQQEWFNLLAADIVPLLARWQALTAAAIEVLRQRMTDFAQRLSDQVAAAWSEAQADECRRLWQQQWRDVAITTLDSVDGTLCWIVRLRK